MLLLLMMMILIINKDIVVKLDNEYWYDQVTKLVKTSHEGNKHVRKDRTASNNKLDK